MFYRQQMHVAANTKDTVTENKIRSITLPLPNVNLVHANGNSDFFLHASFLAFLARVSSLPNVAIGIVADKSGLDSSIESVFSDIIPGLFKVDFDDNIIDVICRCLEDPIKCSRAKTFSKDVFYRYPELRGQKRTPHHNLVMDLRSRNTLEDNDSTHILHECMFLLVFSPDSKEMHLLFTDRSAHDFTNVSNVLRHFPTFLSSMNLEMNPVLKEITLMSIDDLCHSLPLVDEDGLKSETSLSASINRQCQLSPSRIALKSRQKTITYGQMQQEILSLSANICRHLLKKEGEKPLIGLYFPNSIHYVICLLAIIECNAAFLPMPVDYPFDRLAFSLGDANVRQVLTTRSDAICLLMITKSMELCFQTLVAGEEVSFLEIKYPKDENKMNVMNETFQSMQNKVTQCGRNMIMPSLCNTCPDDEHVRLDSHIRDNNANVYEDYCYVIYTSGSTGKPKGVKVKESSVVNLAIAQIKAWDLCPTDNTAQFASIGFDASISEIFTAFLSGGTLSVLNREERNGQEFINAMRSLNVTTITLAPSALNMYGPLDIPSLTKIVSAGEACTLSTALRWTKSTSTRFFNAYGPTEGTVCSTSYEFIPSRDYEDVNRELPIGRAIDGVKIYILDDFMKPVLPGVVGEIYIGGKGLTHGYIGNAAIFNERCFVPNPLDPKMLLYKSGDHAFIDLDGNLTYAGRKDDQIKIRGQRVDLNEIENILIQHPQIEMAVVVIHKCSFSTDTKIACFVTPTVVCVSELREYLAKVCQNT